MSDKKQMQLRLEPVRHKEVDEVGMGILPNGETYLSLGGLARFCGAPPSTIKELSQEWKSGDAQKKERGQKIGELILEWTDHTELPTSLYVEIKSKSSISGVIHAVPESICMAILDYYAHYSTPTKKEALKNYRIAAKFGLRKYIYERLEFDETKILDQSWQLLRERILLNETPAGYFTMFGEATGIIASLIRGGIAINDEYMPDGSLGIHWSKYWNANNFCQTFGTREKIQHHFPESYRQLDPEIWAYPNTALVAFRDWLENIYLPEKYPQYIKTKVKGGKISAEKMDILISSVLPPTIDQKRVTSE